MAGWSSGKKLDPGKYLAQIRDVTETKGKDFKDPNKEIEQFQFECDIQKAGGSGRWEPWTIWTKTEFCDPKAIKDPKFTPNLIRVVRACGFPLPKDAKEAASFDVQAMIGTRFIILVVADPENPDSTETKYLAAPKEAEEKTETRELVGAGVAGATDGWNG